MSTFQSAATCIEPKANVALSRRPTFDMSGIRSGQNPPKHVCSMEGLGVIALQDGAFLLVGEDLLSHVVDHHGTFEVGYGWISAVSLSDE